MDSINSWTPELVRTAIALLRKQKAHALIQILTAQFCIPEFRCLDVVTVVALFGWGGFCLLCVQIFCLFVCLCAMLIEHGRTPEEGVGSTETGVTACCELRWGVGPGNQTQILGLERCSQYPQ